MARVARVCRTTEAPRDVGKGRLAATEVEQEAIVVLVERSFPVAGTNPQLTSLAVREEVNKDSLAADTCGGPLLLFAAPDPDAAFGALGEKPVSLSLVI